MLGLYCRDCHNAVEEVLEGLLQGIKLFEKASRSSRVEDASASVLDALTVDLGISRDRYLLPIPSSLTYLVCLPVSRCAMSWLLTGRGEQLARQHVSEK